MLNNEYQCNSSKWQQQFKELNEKTIEHQNTISRLLRENKSMMARIQQLQSGLNQNEVRNKIMKKISIKEENDENVFEV